MRTEVRMLLQLPPFNPVHVLAELMCTQGLDHTGKVQLVDSHSAVVQPSTATAAIVLGRKELLDNFNRPIPTAFTFPSGGLHSGNNMLICGTTLICSCPHHGNDYCPQFLDFVLRLTTDTVSTEGLVLNRTNETNLVCFLQNTTNYLVEVTHSTLSSQYFQ